MTDSGQRVIQAEVLTLPTTVSFVFVFHVVLCGLCFCFVWEELTREGVEEKIESLFRHDSGEVLGASLLRSGIIFP